MAWKEQVSSTDLGTVCFKNGAHNSGACNLFDEMSASDLRPPSRVLEVTVHQAYYPITEEVLHLVFDPFGEVQHVQVLGESDHMLAQVVFETKYAAAEAFGELHGRCVYTGCCQLDIKWGSSQDLSCCDTMASSYPTMLGVSTTSCPEGHDPDSSLAAAAATTINFVPNITHIEPPTTCLTLGLDVDASANHKIVVFPLVEAVSEDQKLFAEDDATGGCAEVLAIAGDPDSIDVVVQSMTVLDIMDHVTVDELQVPVVPMVTKDVVLVPKVGDTIWSPTATSLPPLVHDNSGAPHAYGKTQHGQTYVMTNSLHMSCTTESVLALKCGVGTALNFFIRDNMTCDMVVLWALSWRRTEWQPWPPPMSLGISCDSAAMRPMPWPSFTIVHEITVQGCYSLLGKHPWPPPARQNFSLVTTEMNHGVLNGAFVKLPLLLIQQQKHGHRWLSCRVSWFYFMSNAVLSTAQTDLLLQEGTVSEAIYIDLSNWFRGNFISHAVLVLLSCQVVTVLVLNDFSSEAPRPHLDPFAPLVRVCFGDK